MTVKEFRIMTVTKGSLLALLWILIGHWNISAQDVHFSQIPQTPMLVNPALTGVFNGKSRAFVNFKDQWRPLGKAYQTTAFGMDFEMFHKPQSNNFFGAGLIAYSDKAGDMNLKTSWVALSLSGIVEVGERQVIAGGLQGGVGQQSIDINNARTSAQYVNGYDPSLPTGEIDNYEASMYGDFSLGVVWSKWNEEMNISSNDESRTTFGIAYHHINRPQMAFGDKDERLYSKLVLHGSLYLGIKNTPLAFLPSGSFVKQGPATEVTIGSYLRYRLKEDSRYTGFIKETTLLFGLHTRVRDALIPSFMLVISEYAFSVSYDINTSALRKGSDGRGGIEFALRFLSPKSLVKGRGRGAKNDAML